MRMVTEGSLPILLGLLFAAAYAGAAGAAGADPVDTELAALVTPAERTFLLTELERIEPPERIRDLAEYGARQLELGGGFYGMMPAQLADPDSIPIPSDAAGRLRAALVLARQREVNRAALAQVNADYAVSFGDEPLTAFLRDQESTAADPPDPSARISLELDVTALRGFLACAADGEITADEAAMLASLPSNRAMLEHRRNLGYVPEPLPDVESLAAMIEMAGSSDPLDRLWCWINSQNAFDYADVALHREGFSRLLNELDANETELVDAVCSRIARYAPEDAQLQTTFAFTVGWAIRGWATPDMAGLNVEQVKDDWPFLFGTLIEETYHRLQLELTPSPSGRDAVEFSDLVAIDTGDAGADRLYEAVTYTVLEGAANLARHGADAPDLAGKAPAGGELMDRFVAEVVAAGNTDAADALINEGLRGNGPLYGLGWALARAIAQHDGERAVGLYQRRGPVAFFLRGAELSVDGGEPLLSPEVISAVAALADRIDATKGN